MYFRERSVMVELSENMNIVNAFHDVNSTLYTVTSIHHKGNVTKSYESSVFQRNIIHEKEKKQSENSKVKTSLFQNKLHNVLNILYYFYFYQKLYIHHWRAACYFRDTNRVFAFGVWRFELGWFQAGLIKWYGRRLRRVTFSESRPYKTC